MGLLRVITRQQRGSGRPAAACVVTLRESKAVLRQRIQIRRRNLAAVTTDVRKPKIISEDEDDVRGLRVSPLGLAAKQRNNRH